MATLVARIRALVALLYPEEMTPHAKHAFEAVLEAVDPFGSKHATDDLPGR